MQFLRFRSLALFAGWLGGAGVAGHGQTPENLLTTTEAVQSLTRAEADESRPVRIEGVVSFSENSWRLMFVEDGTGGIYCEPGALVNIPRTGRRVRIDGIAGNGAFLPIVNIVRLEDLGPSPMPKAKNVSTESLMAGQYDADYVRLTGHVARMERFTSPLPQLSLQVVSGGHPVSVDIVGTDKPAFDIEPCAEIEVEGVFGPKTDGARRVIGIGLLGSSPSQIRLIHDAASVLRGLSPTPLESLPVNAPVLDHRLVRIQGRVHASETNELTIGSGARGIVVHITAGVVVSPGESLDLAVVPDHFDGEQKFRLLKVLGRTADAPIHSIDLEASRLADWTHYGARVRTEGEFVHRSPGARGDTLVMRAGDQSFEVDLRFEPGERWNQLAAGSRLRAMGILRLSSPRPGAPPTPRVVVASMEDLRLLTAPPWPLHRTLAVVTFLTTGLACGLVALAMAHQRLRASSLRIENAEKDLRELNEDLERRIAERTRALAASESRFRTLVEGTDVILWEFDPGTGACQYISPQAARLGYPLHAWSQPGFWEEHIHPEDRTGTAATARECIAAGRNHRLQYRFLAADGRLVWFDASITVEVRREGGRIVRGVISDVTERREAELSRARLEGQLRQSQKMEAIGTLAGGIAHDFNNILGVIIGNAELALAESKGNPSLTESVDQILQASHRARELVRQILTFSRREEMRNESVSMDSVLADTVKLLRASLPARLRVLSTVVPPIPPLLGTRALLQQILINLATNAAQAIGPNDGQIELDLRAVGIDENQALARPGLKPGPHVRLTVRDNGPGIPRELLGRIFEPFFTTKRPGEGTGLGLSVVHGIVQSHHGVITVESAPGRGTSFEILLPSETSPVPPPPAARRPPTPASQTAATGCILLIDDEPAVLKIGEKILQQSGYRVRSFLHPVDALNLFRSEPETFDLVITDFSMPGLTGAELAPRIREVRRDIPMLICTGFGGGLTREKARALGFFEILHKPIEVGTLGDTVKAALLDAAREHPSHLRRREPAGS